MEAWVLKNFYCIEGIDGIGKTTACEALMEMCQLRGKDILVTQEPSGSTAGLLSRMLLGKEDNTFMAYLFAADRHAHVFGKGCIVDEAKKRPVLTDRYFFSSKAYQGFELYGALVDSLNEIFPYPEIAFYLKGDAHEALKRQEKRGDEIKGYVIDKLIALSNRFDIVFETADKKGPRDMRIVTLDASCCSTEIARQMYKEIFKEEKDGKPDSN